MPHGSFFEPSQLDEVRYAWCHSNSPGIVPNLLEMTPEKHPIFKEIVLGGVLEAQGMASFADMLSESDADAIHACLVDEARKEIGRLQDQQGAARTPY